MGTPPVRCIMLTQGIFADILPFACSAKNEDGDTPMELAEHHPTLQSLLRSWSPAMATSTSGTATATTFSRANTSHAGSTAGGTASAARAGSGEIGDGSGAIDGKKRRLGSGWGCWS
eukprot:1153799-Pelagomonas_calceolata.AAC.11